MRTGWVMDRWTKIHDALYGTVDAFDERYELNDRQIEMLHTIIKFAYELGKETEFIELNRLRSLDD